MHTVPDQANEQRVLYAFYGYSFAAVYIAFLKRSNDGFYLFYILYFKNYYIWNIFFHKLLIFNTLRIMKIDFVNTNCHFDYVFKKN